jgi:hypothetical protein
MSVIPSFYANNFESVKAAKKSFIDDYLNEYPHRLSSMRLTGGESFVEDQRLQPRTADSLTTAKYNYELDYSLLPVYTRAFHQRLPIIQFPSPDQNIREFSMVHNPNSFWRCIYDTNTNEALELPPIKIGSSTVTEYTRPTTEDPWEEGGTYLFEDYYSNWVPYIQPSGGYTWSGGRDEDNDENSLAIIIYGGGPAAYRPIYRLPWEDPWENDSTVFSESFAEFIADQNLTWGGGWSGSTTATLEFT